MYPKNKVSTSAILRATSLCWVKNYGTAGKNDGTFGGAMSFKKPTRK